MTEQTDNPTPDSTPRVPKIRHTYWRDYAYDKPTRRFRPTPKGGISVTYRIESADDNEIRVRAGFAFCSPRDCFVKGIGRSLSWHQFEYDATVFILDTKEVFADEDFNIRDVECALKRALRDTVEMDTSLWPRHVVRFLRGE